jgi:hypothetical protein
VWCDVWCVVCGVEFWVNYVSLSPRIESMEECRVVD